MSEREVCPRCHLPEARPGSMERSDVECFVRTNPCLEARDRCGREAEKWHAWRRVALDVLALQPRDPKHDPVQLCICTECIDRVAMKLRAGARSVRR